MVLKNIFVDTGLADDLAIAKAEEEMNQAAEIVNKSKEAVNLDEPLISPDHVHIEKMNVNLLDDDLNTYEAVKTGSGSSSNES